MLEAQGYKTWVGGNIGNPLFSNIEEIEEDHMVVLELSSFQLMTMKEDSFHTAIKTYLDERAKTDELFAKSYAKEGKSINKCCKYIMGEARKRGTAVCMTDEEVYGLAVHYYDEDDIKINPVRETAKVNTKQSAVELKAVNAAAEIARKKSAEPEPQKKERYIEGNLFDMM